MAGPTAAIVIGTIGRASATSRYLPSGRLVGMRWCPPSRVLHPRLRRTSGYARDRRRARWFTTPVQRGPLNLGDEEGRPLDGSHKYVLHFEKGATPLVDAFWSITLYDSEGFQVANSLNRFAVSSWMRIAEPRPAQTRAEGPCLLPPGIRLSSVLLLIGAATWSVIAMIAATICPRCSSK
jgi:Protein of unknown function (DUF1214)